MCLKHKKYTDISCELKLSGHNRIVANRPAIKSHVTFGTLIHKHGRVHGWYGKTELRAKNAKIAPCQC